MLQGRMLQGQCSCEAWCGWAPGYDENCYQALHCCACDECIERGVKPPKWWDPNSNYGDRSCLVWGVERTGGRGNTGVPPDLPDLTSHDLCAYARGPHRVTIGAKGPGWPHGDPLGGSPDPRGRRATFGGCF